MIRLALVALLLATPAAADEMAFFIRNQYSRAIVVELYGRQSVWPGRDKVYSLGKGEQKSVPIDCQAGETVCWAAWVNGDAGTYWGVGPDSVARCDECCVTCASKTTTAIVIGE